jgi:hypothetical protein
LYELVSEVIHPPLLQKSTVSHVHSDSIWRGLNNHEYPGLRLPEDTLRGWETWAEFSQEMYLDLPARTILPFQGQEETSTGQRDN